MKEHSEYQGPLTGLNVIDFGHYYAGPMAAMLLADQGANVIRVVRPGEPELREQQYRLLNRNKKLLTLDLKTDEGKTQALSLIENADVVIENFRPGVMKRLGLDYASAKRKNPGLVYLSLPGFASTDKDRAHIQAREGVLGAACGLYTHLSYYRQDINYPPVYSAMPHCSIYGAVHGATAIMAALIAREEHGIGTVIETPLADAGFSGFAFARMPSPTDSILPEMPDELKSLAFSPDDNPAVQLDKLYQVAQRTRRQFYGAFGNFYPCADGRRVIIWTAYYQGLTERLLTALGIEKQAKREGFMNEGSWVSGLENNLSNYNDLSPERKQRLDRWLADIFLTKTAAAWEIILEQAGIPAAVVRTRDEWLALKPLLASGVLTDMKKIGVSTAVDGASTLTVPGRLADISGPAGSLMSDYREAEPISFYQARELLDMHISATTSKTKKAQQPLKKGDLLRGLKVLDLNNVLAGPTSAHVLAQYGAEVIKADPPQLNDGPGIIHLLLEQNQGKRSILNDVRTASGREVFRRLVAWADVVVHNILDDTGQRVGVAHAQLQAINPTIVSCQMSAFGGTRRGGWEMRSAFDPVVQCASGLMTQFGSLDTPQPHGMNVAADTLGGFSLAFTALVGVYRQRKTGCAVEGRTSLARATNHYQLPWTIAENGCSDWGEPQGQLAVGKYVWQRLYACRDGWIYISTTEQGTSTLMEAVAGQRTADEAALEAAFAKQTCAWWQQQLDAVDIGCHRVLSLRDIHARAGERQVDNGSADETTEGTLECLRRQQHPCGSPVLFMAPNWVRVGEAQTYRRLTPAPRLGEHTKEILQELGFNEDEIADLVRFKVSYECLPAIGSKDKYFFEATGE